MAAMKTAKVMKAATVKAAKSPKAKAPMKTAKAMKAAKSPKAPEAMKAKEAMKAAKSPNAMDAGAEGHHGEDDEAMKAAKALKAAEATDEEPWVDVVQRVWVDEKGVRGARNATWVMKRWHLDVHHLEMHWFRVYPPACSPAPSALT